MRHKLLSKDIEAMTGECAVCGPVELNYKPSSGYRCKIAYRQQKGQWTHGKGYQSIKEREFRIASQSGGCGICGRNDLVLHRDHDHKTGEDRGFLCRGCNIALGHLRDSANLAEAVATYLRWHNTEETWYPKSVEVFAL